MSDKIKASDLFDDSFLSEPKAKIDGLTESLNAAASAAKALKSTTKSIQGNQLNDSTSVNKQISDLAKLEKAKNDYTQQMLRADKLVSDSKKRIQKESEDLLKSQAKLTKEQEKQAKVLQQANSLHAKLSKQLIENKKVVKDLLASGKELTEQDKKLIAETQELDKRLKHIDSQVGDNQRNVGAYKEALDEAAAEMGSFGGAVTRVIRTLKQLNKENKEAESGAQKFGNTLKVIATGLILAAITAVVAGLESFKEKSQVATDTAKKLGEQAIITSGKILSFGLAFDGAYDAINNFYDALKKSRPELLSLEVAFQKLKLDQEDFNEISEDTTIGYNERIEAQKQSMALSEKIAAIEIKKAEIEKNVIDLEVKKDEAFVGRGLARAELYEKQNQALLKYNEAVDRSGDLERQNAEKTRKIIEEKTIEEIDLILKKKQSANAEKAILEDQIKDQRLQIEERVKLNEKLSSVNKKTTQEELKTFKEGFNIKFNSNELLKEQDAIILQQKLLNLKTLEGHGLGEAGISELAKIIKQAQESEIDNKKTIIQLDEDLAKREQKLFEIKSQIVDLQNQEDIKLKDREIEETRNDKNISTLKKIKLEEVQETKLRDLKRKALIEQENSAEVIANNTISDTQELNAEILRLQTKLNNDLLENDLDHEAKEKELENARKEYLKKELQEEFNTTIDFAEQSIKRKEELQKQQLDNDLDMRQRNIEQQQQLAIAGRDNTLAFEKAAAAKDELAKQQLAIKEEKREKTLAFLKLFAAYADKGEPDQALGKALVQMAIAGAITGSYFEGTENVGEDLKGNKVHSGRDGYHIAVDGSERIMTGSQNKMIGDLTNDELANLARNYQDGYIPAYITAGNTGSFAQNTTNALLLNQFTQMNDKIQSIETALKNRPSTTFKVDKRGIVSEEQLKNGLIKSIKHKPSNNNYI